MIGGQQATAGLPTQGGYHSLHKGHRAKHIGFIDGAELLHRRLFQGAAAANSGVADEHVEATLPLHQRVDVGLHAVLLQQVHLHGLDIK